MEITRVRYGSGQRPAKKPRFRRRLLLIFAALVVSFGSTYSFLAVKKELPVVSAEPLQPSISQPVDIVLPWPSAGQAAIGSAGDGLLGVSSQTETAQPIASMAKVITSLAIMAKEPFSAGGQGGTYTLTANDVAIYNSYVAKLGSVMPVREGQAITQYQALQAMLLPSANNVADSMVLKIFGSMDAYLTYANTMVKDFGMVHTIVADASGFSPRTVSTPSDMVILAQKLLLDPVLAEIVGQTQAVIPTSGPITNTNRLLSDADVIGIKTGTTDEAGSCLLFAGRHEIADGQTVTVVGVIMGQPNWPTLQRNVRKLLDAAYQGFGIIEVVPAGHRVGTYQAPWGEATDIVTGEALTTIGWKEKVLQVETSLDTIDAPISKGAQVGSLKVASNPAAEVKLVTTQEMTAPNIWWRLRNYW